HHDGRDGVTHVVELEVRDGVVRRSSDNRSLEEGTGVPEVVMDGDSVVGDGARAWGSLVRVRQQMGEREKEERKEAKAKDPPFCVSVSAEVRGGAWVYTIFCI
ncbi:hypothetical protein U1Q18_017735, partial [Sarracenia purpurea var. burkii]